MIDFEQLFQDYADKTKKVFAHDRTQTVGASEVFDCIRKSYFKKTEADKDPDLEESWGATSRGDLIENHYVVPALSSTFPAGVDYVGAGEDQKTFIDIENRISATPDGLVCGIGRDALKKYGVEDIESDCFVVEIKSVDPRVNLKEAKTIHKGQAIIQMGLIREQTNYQPKFAVILYFDASFLDNLSVFVVEFDQQIFNNGKVRAKSVFTATSAIEMRAEGKLSHSCDFCQYTKACAKANKSDMPEEAKTYPYTEEQAKTLQPLIVAHKTAVDNEKKFESEKKLLKEQIKDYLKDLGVRRMAGTDWKVSYTWSKGRSSFDLDAMRQDGIEVDDYKKEGEGHEVLTVTI